MARKKTPTYWERIEKNRLFIGLFPAGIVYADCFVEEHGDYKKLAFLPYDTLQTMYYFVTHPCEAQIKEHAAGIIARRGESFVVSGCGQTVLLGGGK